VLYGGETHPHSISRLPGSLCPQMGRAFSLPMTPEKTHLTDKISKPPVPKPRHVSRKGNTPKRKLKERTFCKEYIIDLNGTRAATAAGYAARSAHTIASKLLQKVHIKAQLAKLMQKHADKLEISADKVLGELAKMGFSNMLDYMRVDEDGEFRLDFSKLTREQAAAIQEYTVDATGGTGDGERKQVMRTRFKLADKARSLELLGKYLKLFVDKVEVTGLGDLPAVLAAARARAQGKK